MLHRRRDRRGRQRLRVLRRHRVRDLLHRLVGARLVDVERHLPVAGVDQVLLAVARPERRRHESAAHHVGVLALLAGGQVEAVDVLGAAAAVGGVVDALAVRRVDRVVLVGVAGGHRDAQAGLVEVDAEDLAVGAGADHRHQHERLAVGRERRRAVEDVVVGEPRDRHRVEVEHEDVEPGVLAPREGDLLAVGAEARRLLLLDLVHVDDAADAAVDRVEEQQAAALLALGEHRDGVAVRREGEVAAQAAAELQLLGDQVLVLARERLGQVADEGPLAGVEQHHVHLAVIGAEGRHQVAGGRGDRRDLVGVAVGLDPEHPPEVAGLAGLDQLRQVLLAQPAPELDVEVLGLDLEGALDGAIDARTEGVAGLVQEIEEALVAPAVLDEREHRVAEAVGEETLDLDAADRRDDVVDHRVAQEHRVAHRLVAAHVARHALDEPGRRAVADGLRQAALEEHLVLEDVGQLVADQGDQQAVRIVDRQHHAEARRAGEGADALGDEVEDDVVLLERRVGGEIDQRDRVLDLEIEETRDVVVVALGEGDHLLQRRLLLRVVIDVEVRGVVDAPVELAVGDLVLAEAVALHRRPEALLGAEASGRQGQQRQAAGDSGGDPWEGAASRSRKRRPEPAGWAVQRVLLCALLGFTG